MWTDSRKKWESRNQGVSASPRKHEGGGCDGGVLGAPQATGGVLERGLLADVGMEQPSENSRIGVSPGSTLWPDNGGDGSADSACCPEGRSMQDRAAVLHPGAPPATRQHLRDLLPNC